MAIIEHGCMHVVAYQHDIIDSVRKLVDFALAKDLHDHACMMTTNGERTVLHTFILTHSHTTLYVCYYS